mgnify:CR=1 FL=1
MAKIINGKEISAQIREQIKEETLKMQEENGVTPGLAVIIVGDDPASKVYVANKKKACAEVGFYSEEYALPEETDEHSLLELIDKLNKRPDIDGILVQLPLPKHIDAKKIVDSIRPDKDVDAFHPVNVGRIMIGDYTLAPCTPSGVMELIRSTGVTVEGKNCVVVGRSDIVGKPQAMLLLHENGTVTICHSKTKDLAGITKKADILVVAVGRAGFITGDMIKKGAVVIDVGMNRNEEGKLVGDVDFDSAAEVAGYITPVPGGVGPMTITMLLRNTLRAAENH